MTKGDQVSGDIEGVRLQREFDAAMIEEICLNIEGSPTSPRFSTRQKQELVRELFSDHSRLLERVNELEGASQGCGSDHSGSRDEPAVGATAALAIRDVAVERQRQIEVEGWTPQLDDAYEAQELAQAAAYYTLMACDLPDTALYVWPNWPDQWRKSTTPRRDLVKAGALIIAEIERLDRAANTQASASGKAEGAFSDEREGSRADNNNSSSNTEG